MDSHMLSILQSKLPGIPISAHIVEPSIALIENFKGKIPCHRLHCHLQSFNNNCRELKRFPNPLAKFSWKRWVTKNVFRFPFPLIASVAKASNLQKIPFTWNAVSCAEYEKQVKDTKAATRFDFIDMIQVQLFYNHSNVIQINLLVSLYVKLCILSLRGGQLHICMWLITTHLPSTDAVLHGWLCCCHQVFPQPVAREGETHDNSWSRCGRLQTSVTFSGQVTFWPLVK